VALATEHYCDSADLTRQQGILATHCASGYCDQLSQFDRRSGSELWQAFPVERRRAYVSRGRVITFRWRDNGQSLPTWFDPTMQRFADLITLESNWDSYNGQTIDLPTVNKAAGLLDELLSPACPPPSVVPLSSGGLQLEWHRNGQDLELVFEPGEPPEFYYRNGLTGAEEEGMASTQTVFLAQVIRTLK
jgi:hypothetical protein